jgi:hypothetical protein
VKLRVEDITTGFHLHKIHPLSDKRGFMLEQALPGARVGEIDVDARLEAFAPEETAGCQETSPDQRPQEIAWGLPVDQASFWVTTAPSEDGLPQYGIAIASASQVTWVRR